MTTLKSRIVDLVRALKGQPSQWPPIDLIEHSPWPQPREKTEEVEVRIRALERTVEQMKTSN